MIKQIKSLRQMEKPEVSKKKRGRQVEPDKALFIYKGKVVDRDTKQRNLLNSDVPLLLWIQAIRLRWR